MPISHLLGESFYRAPQQALHVPTNTPSVDNVTTNFANQLHINATPTLVGEEKVVLIDTDAGTEDAWAIFMALAANKSQQHNFNLLGITTVHGSTHVDNVAQNVTRILDAFGEPSIGVFKGADSPLLGKHSSPLDPIPALHPYNGTDGFGDAHLPTIQPRLESMTAVDAMIKYAEDYSGRLTLVCLGPLTNLAIALRLRPDLKKKLKELYILGGNMEGMGNITVASEFNFFVDPEAAFAVLNESFPCPVYILPWETSAKFGALSHGWRMNVLGSLRTKEMDLLNRIEAKILETYRESWLASDGILMACLINPAIVLSAESYNCTVELQGRSTRGMMVVDKCFLKQQPSNATVITEVNQNVLESMLVWSAGGAAFVAK